jgi:hypothetical protein
MENLVPKSNKSEVFFKLKDNSNYEVLLTYDRSEVIEFEQFKKLSQILFNTDTQFLTINQRIVNRSTIIDISPTDKKTLKQKLNKENNLSEDDYYVDDGKGNIIKLSEFRKRYKKQL